MSAVNEENSTTSNIAIGVNGDDGGKIEVGRVVRMVKLMMMITLIWFVLLLVLLLMMVVMRGEAEAGVGRDNLLC